MSRLLPVLLALSSITMPAKAVAGSFDVPAWSLATGVGDSSTGLSDNSEVVQNPFQDEHHVLLGPSQAHSYFDFSWTPDTASFLIAASHAAFDGNGGTRSVSAGNIYITPNVDLLLTATGTYDYDMPGWDMRVGYGLVIYDGEFRERFVEGHTDDTFIDGPTTAGFSLDAQFVLPAGETSILSYIILIDAFDSTGLLATGSGDIHITLAPVPEPSTLMTLAIVATLLPRPMRRPRLRR